MPKTSNYSATLRELAAMAAEQGRPMPDVFAELEADLGRLQMPPAGFQLAPGCADHWIGEAVGGDGWTVTPAWNATTHRHSVEVWTEEGHTLTSAESLEFAAALLEAARNGLAGRRK